MKALLSRLNIDPYIVSILGMVALASALPAAGRGMVAASDAGAAMIGLMFFLQGARLAPRAALAGARHWRLHAAVLACTFVLFPALGLTARAIAPGLLTPALWAGVLMLCVLPSTVQSSIAFTSIARGNVPAALCAATASNLLGILLTPLLAGMLLQRARRPLGARRGRHRGAASRCRSPRDSLRGPGSANGWAATSGGPPWSIAARSCSWSTSRSARASPTASGTSSTLAIFPRCCCWMGRCWRRSCWRPPQSADCSASAGADRITVVFCGSKKSLAAGLPMASVLFAGQSLGLVVLPLMLFHQLQLMVCAALARRYAATPALPRGAALRRA